MPKTAEPTIEEKVNKAGEEIQEWGAVLAELTSPASAADFLDEVSAEIRALQPRSN
jgi:hypothetical protein